MKSLDEVIEILEKVVKHDYVWFDEKTALMTIETLTDTLQYLREYQWQMTNPDGDHQQIEKCRALLQDFYRNDPLSWDELKGLEGKPVWIEAESLSVGVSPLWKDWYIIKSFSNEEFMYCNDGFEWAKEMQGRLWQAYRKERK